MLRFGSMAVAPSRSYVSSRLCAAVADGGGRHTRRVSGSINLILFVFDRGGCCASPTLPDKMIERSATTRIGGEQSRISGTRRSSLTRSFVMSRHDMKFWILSCYRWKTCRNGVYVWLCRNGVYVWLCLLAAARSDQDIRLLQTCLLTNWQYLPNFTTIFCWHR
jgi:hypothetical protein